MYPHQANPNDIKHVFFVIETDCSRGSAKRYRAEQLALMLTYVRRMPDKKQLANLTVTGSVVQRTAYIEAADGPGAGAVPARGP